MNALDVARGTRKTPAWWFFVVLAVTHLPLGVGGLLVDRSFPIGSEATRSAGSAHAFGVFETNGWHALAALVLGVAAVYFIRYPAHARTAALAIGGGHVAIFLSLVLADPSTWWLASNDADQVVHASTAIGGLATGLATRPQK